MPSTPKVGGGQPGNRNRTKHGLRAVRSPKGCSWIDSSLTAFRRYVQDEILSRDGGATLYQEALLQSACRHEQRAMLAARWLRVGGDSLPLSEKLALTKAVCDATDARDKCLDRLGLDRRDVATITTALYQPVAATACHAAGPDEGDTASESSDAPDAAEGTPEASMPEGVED